MDRKIQQKYAELLRLQIEIVQLELDRSNERRGIFKNKKSSYGFPFDLLEAIIHGGLSLLERSVRKGVDTLSDAVSRSRKR